MAVALLVYCQAAAAREWPTVGWFDIVEADDTCGALSDYEFDGRPDVSLMVMVSTDDRVLVSLASPGWSNAEKEVYDDISWSVNGSRYAGKAYGLVTDVVKRGFVGRFGTEFLDDLAKGSSLYVEKGDTVVTHINLFSSGRAMQVLRQCVASLKAQTNAKQRAEKRWDYIEKDPFAKTTK